MNDWVRSSTCAFVPQSILKYVNKQVKWSTNRQKLADYQSKLDLSAMEKSQHPIAQLFKVSPLSPS